MSNNLKPTRNAVSLSFGIDPDSELLLAGGECLRTIRGDSVPFFRSFIEGQLYESLVQEGIVVPSQIVNQEDPHSLVLRHPEMAYVLYPYEWTASMLKDAALMFLYLVEKLERNNYTLKDGHPWNVIFRGPNPVFVDITSVTPITSKGHHPWQIDFINYFLKPLRLYAADLAPYARLGLSQLFGPPSVWLDDPLSMSGAKAFSAGRKSGLRFAALAGYEAIKQKLGIECSKEGADAAWDVNDLREVVKSLTVTQPDKEWSAYYKATNELPTFDPRVHDLSKLAESTPKHRLISSLLQEQCPKTLLDIGCNAGIYSFFAEKTGACVVGLDTDEQAVDEMYRAARDGKANIVGGCADFIAPIHPAEYLHKPRLRSLHCRMRSEMVLCLAVVHHWVFKRLQLKFSDVVQVLSSVTDSTLVVEFIPPEDKHVSKWMTPAFSWYSLDNFIAALRPSFPNIEVHESFPAPRKLLVCRK